MSPSSSGPAMTSTVPPGLERLLVRQTRCDDVTNADNAHNHISDPKTADRGPYTVFCSYMVTRCGVKIS